LKLGERLPVLVPLSAYANALAKKDLPLRPFPPAYFSDRGFKLPLADLFLNRSSAARVKKR